MKATLLAFGLFGVLGLHDFFVSILTIHHSADKKELDLTWRMTAHDVEHALGNVAELKLGSEKEYPKADSVLNDYLGQHLHLAIGGSPLKWRWIGRELEGENLFCYLQADDVTNVEGLTVANSLLQDVFGEQDNIVDLEAGGRTFRQHFVRGTPAFTFSLK